jgi:hypothetical protein
MSQSIDHLLDRLADGDDLRQVLGDLGITPRRAARALNSRRAKARLDARRALAHTQVELQAMQQTAHAMKQLAAMLKSDKPETLLKATALLLGVAFPKAASREKRSPATRPVDPEVAREWLAAIADVMAARRRVEAMGPAPRQLGAGTQE